MFKKIALGVATAFAVTLGAGAVTSNSAEAAEFTFTITDGYAAPLHNVHDRGHARRDRGHAHRNRGHARRDGRNFRHERRHGRRHDRWNDRRNGWRHTQFRDERPRRRGRREVCHVTKKIVTFYDRYGTPHRKVKRHRTCEWVRR